MRTEPLTRQLSAALNTMENIHQGDLIWTLDTSSAIPTYYLCELTSKYTYFKKNIQDACGIANGFQCTYHAITTNEIIPKNVIRLLNSKGLIYELDNEDEVSATKLLFQSLATLINTE